MTGLQGPGGIRSLHDLGKAKIAGVVVLLAVAATGAGRGAMMTNAAMKEIAIQVTSQLCGTATIATMTVATVQHSPPIKEPVADVELRRRVFHRRGAAPLHRLQLQDIHRPCGALHQPPLALAGQLVNSNQMFSRMKTAMM